jgi:hypothetical protein
VETVQRSDQGAGVGVTIAEEVGVADERPGWGSRAEAWDRRRDGRALVTLFLLCFVAYLLTASYTINQVNDTRDTAVSAWSLGTRGTLALPEEWPADSVHWGRPGKDGGRYTDRFPGPTLWAAPFYTVTEWISPREAPPHPYLANYAPAGVAAALAAALAISAAYAAYRRIGTRAPAWFAAAFLGLGTGMWSVAAGAMWTHGLGSLLLLLGVLGTASRRYAWAGAAFALAILCRPQYAVIPAVIGLWEGIRLRDLVPVVKIGVVSAAGLAAMSIYSQVIFGTWLPVAGYSTHKVGDVASTGLARSIENIVLSLGHPLRGLLVYTPMLLLLLPGIDRGWKVAPAWVRSSAVAGLVYALVQLRANTWTGGADFFGSRLLLETLVLASPLLLLTFHHYILPAGKRVRLAANVLIVFSIVLHGVGATVMKTGFYGPDGVEVWEERMAELCEEEPELCDSDDAVAALTVRVWSACPADAPRGWRDREGRWSPMGRATRTSC